MCDTRWHRWPQVCAARLGDDKNQQSQRHLTAGPQACATKQQSDCNQPQMCAFQVIVLLVAAAVNRQPGNRGGLRFCILVCWCYCVRAVGVQPHSHQFIPMPLCEMRTGNQCACTTTPSNPQGLKPTLPRALPHSSTK